VIGMADDLVRVPVFQEYMNPMLQLLRVRSQPVSIEELDRAIVEKLELAPNVRSLPHDPERPDRTEVSYRIAWARSYLKQAGLVDNPQRGKWLVTEKGATAGTIDAYSLASEVASVGKKKESAGPTSIEIELEDDREEVNDEELSAARVSEELATQLRGVRTELELEGELLTTEEVSGQLQRFRSLFGPEALPQLDGAALLERMHGRGRGESLVYWLEFKNDNEFSARFGSIGGGSALKFGIYLSADTGQWMTGSSAKQERLSLEEALAKVRSQREQLLAGARVLTALPANVAEIDYGELQMSMQRAAPDVAETSWGHKYFALLFPNVLEPFHGSGYQTHQLYKLLKVPGGGRYENARIFAGVAQQLGMSLIDLGAVLSRRNGGTHGYWRVGTTIGDRSEWERMASGGFAAIGWDALGDLSDVTPDTEGKDALRARLVRKYPADSASTTTKARNQVFQFVHGAAERDVVLAMVGSKVRGIGRITGPYFFKPEDGPFPHRRQVEWGRVGDWPLPKPEGLQTTFVPIKKPVNIVEAEARLIGVPQRPAPRTVSVPTPLQAAARPQLPLLPRVIARVQLVLQRKRQVILHGPPGTGKTYWAKKAIEELAARAWFDADGESLTAAQRSQLRSEQAVQMCSFHPAYGYEDFLEGFRPDERGGNMSFSLRDGVFKKLCQRAERDTSKRPFFLLIDEINRGDIPRIFGELLTALEKRGEPMTLPLSGTSFSVPDNVYVVGTMNTADRSIALLDAALRRRFGFIELLPDSSTLAGVSVGGLPLGPWLDELNRRIVSHVGRDARHLQVGHSYLLPSGAPVRDLGRFVEILRDDVIPLLEEYCYEDFENLEKILGPVIVMRAQRRIDAALFEPLRHQDLIQAMLSSFDSIVATRAAVAADPAESSELEDEDEVAPGVA
jgi:5-methylcytosine-specific restriction protein B